MAINVSVFPYVCLFARISQITHVRTSRNFLYMLPAAVARSRLRNKWCASGLVANDDMFPHSGGQWDRIKDDVMFGRVRQVAAPVGRRGRSMVSPIASSTYEM